MLYALGRFDEAEPEWRELAALCDRLLGADDPDAIDAHQNHSMTLARLNRFAEAEAEIADVVQKLTAVNGSDDVATLGSRTSQAVYLDTLGRSAESEAAWRELVEAKGRVFGVSHFDTILARERLASSLYDQRRLREAAAEYGEVMALRAATVGAEHPDTARAELAGGHRQGASRPRTRHFVLTPALEKSGSDLCRRSCIQHVLRSSRPCLPRRVGCPWRSGERSRDYRYPEDDSTVIARN